MPAGFNTCAWQLVEENGEVRISEKEDLPTYVYAHFMYVGVRVGTSAISRKSSNFSKYLMVSGDRNNTSRRYSALWVKGEVIERRNGD
jgi:hypothetical protein